MVLGAVLLTGAFVLSVRQRRQNAADAVATTATVATTLAGRRARFRQPAIGGDAGRLR